MLDTIFFIAWTVLLTFIIFPFIVFITPKLYFIWKCFFATIFDSSYDFDDYEDDFISAFSKTKGDDFDVDS